MPEHPLNVSVTAPLTPAFERVKTLLFRPFDLSTWLVLGFCAWLAQLGRSGGGGGGFNFGGGNRGGGGGLRPMLEDAREYILNNLHWIVPVALGVAVVVLLIWLVLAWLNSRGQFMFLHCVARHRAEISLPWHRYGAHANSLFVFRVIVGVVALAVAAPLVIAGLWTIDQLITGELAGPPVLVLVLLILAGGGAALLLALVQKLTRDFVVPIMFLHTADWLVGWRRFGLLLAGNKAQFLLYILFSLLLWVVIGVIILTVVVLTCCCAGCLMAIPYVGTVLLLPVYVFARSYSLAYLAQYGPEFNVFDEPPGPVLA